MVTNKYSKLMSLEIESVASALPIRTYEIDVDFSMYPTTPKKTDIIYINGDTNSSIIKARLLMGDKPVNLFGKMVVMNVREGMGYDNLSILGEVIDIDNAIVSFSRNSILSIALFDNSKFAFVLIWNAFLYISETFIPLCNSHATN